MLHSHTDTSAVSAERGLVGLQGQGRGGGTAQLSNQNNRTASSHYLQ